MHDISVEESEELPRILAPIAEDAPAAVLGGASALDQAPVDRDVLIMAIEAASPALARLKVGPGLSSSCSPSCLWLSTSLLQKLRTCTCSWILLQTMSRFTGCMVRVLRAYTEAKYAFGCTGKSWFCMNYHHAGSAKAHMQ